MSRGARALTAARVTPWLIRGIVVITALALAADTLLYSSIAPLVPTYVHRFGLSKTQAGVLVGAYAAGMMVGALPLGFAAARAGAKRTLLFGLVLLIVASTGFGLATTAAMLDITRTIQGVGGAGMWAGALVWLTETGGAERRGELIGIGVGAAVAGQVLGPALARNVQ
jgi:MFS family permease